MVFLLNESIFTVEGCFLEKASQSLRPAAAKGFGIVLGGFADPKNTSQTASVPEGRAQRAAISSAGKGRQAFFGQKKTPPTFSSQGRGILLTRYHPGSAAGHPTALKASTRPQPITRPTVPPTFGSGGLLRDQLSTGDPHRFAPATRLSEGGRPCLFSRRCI